MSSRNRQCTSILTLTLTLAGCAGEAERATVKDVSSLGRERTAAKGQMLPALSESGSSSKKEGSDLGRYIATAMEQSPELRSAFERWESSVHQISQARRLPDPKISFGYFLQSVETRVGPQRAKFGLQQSFPWPTQLSAGADSAAAQTRALHSRIDALALVVRQQVEAAYWKLWLVRQLRKIHSEHLLVVRSLSESVLSRVATGTASLAEQLQVDLTAARLEDLIQSMGEDERTAIAALHVAMGSQEPSVPSTEMTPPDALLPVESFEQLEESTRTHPLIESYGHLASSKEELARAKNAERYPSFSVGVDWILTGQASMPEVEDSGKDALMLGAGMSLPLWQGNYSDGVEAARAEARAERFTQSAAINRAVFELKASLAAVRDATRRARFYEQTLLPQADSAYQSVLGAYATGEVAVAQTLLAQRDLLEIRDELSRARAEYALAWADLERIVGRSLAGRVVTAQDDLGATNGTR